MSGALIELIPFRESKAASLECKLTMTDGVVPLPELEYLVLKLLAVGQQPLKKALK